MKKYTKTSNATFNLGYHIVWTPKYRGSFLLNLDQSYLKKVFYVCSIKVLGIIENIQIMPDHIHIFLRLKQNHFSIPKIIQIFKGFSSFCIRKKYSWMKKYKALWSSGYFIESVGNMSESVIKKYINNQKTNIKPTYKYKNKVLKSKTYSTYNGLSKKEEEKCKKEEKQNTKKDFYESFKIR